MDGPKSRSASPPSIANSAENYEMSYFLSPELPWKHPDSPSAQSIDESRPIQQLVVWGVGWWKPTLMFSFLLLGMVSAVAHHEYYSHMSGTVTYSLARQQWTIWIGIGFSFLVLFFLNSANGVAFTQYIWVVARNKDTTIGGLDKLFGSSEDIMGFISPEFWRHAKVAILMAFVIWSMALTGIVPPGTISVVPSLRTETNLTNVNTFDWNNQGTEGLLIQDKQGNTTIYYPRAPVMGIASVTSQTKAVLNLPNPGSNSSYKMQFYGPAFKCNAANSSQQTAFDYYSLRYLEENDQVIVQQYQNNYTTFQPGNSKLRIWSAFSPQLFGFITNDFGFPDPDHYSNFFYAQLPPDTAYRGTWGGALSVARIG